MERQVSASVRLAVLIAMMGEERSRCMQDGEYTAARLLGKAQRILRRARASLPPLPMPAVEDE